MPKGSKKAIIVRAFLFLFTKKTAFNIHSHIIKTNLKQNLSHALIHIYMRLVRLLHGNLSCIDPYPLFTWIGTVVVQRYPVCGDTSGGVAILRRSDGIGLVDYGDRSSDTISISYAKLLVEILTVAVDSAIRV
jgi:hypothetical protein